ncbi:OmpH family outer membrane protein [Mucilaginibacter arboris]|uniref:OmpH family outer membrane protein n=1 Tax=Mucilaginibacter arboris TaxID=2682090 RepID=A0A7K1SUI5_9SPHI|nr:OmpH family outer membrane protein [Mucilaginibacter arboris]MVN20985.1 OmpH family outer membrane protein [Mucilaginibacter arboris]
MKITVSRLTLGIAVAAMAVACNQKPQTTNATAEKTPATSTSEKAEIVYVNSDSLLSKYDYFKDMSSRLEDKGKKAQVDVSSKGQAFQREVAEYQKGAATLSADQRAATEQRLARKQQELQTYNQNASAQIQQEQASENAKLYDKIADFMKGYAKEKGYKLILTYSKANPTVLFGDESLNVTNDVVKILNDNYKKEKK